jgi:hypothetical protein
MSSDYEGVIILGVPRSGTTLLRRLLNAHPGFACPPETNIFSAGSRFLKEATFAGGLSVGVVPGLGFSGFEREEVLARTREFLFDFLRKIRNDARKAYWVEKTAVDIFHLDAIETLCAHHCRYICITRHPLDVICSLGDLSRKMQSHLPEIYSYIQRYRSPIEAYAHAWRDGNRRLQSFIATHPDWCVKLRYEDLVTSPTEQLERIFAFLGQPTDCEALIESAMKDREAAGLGDWKTYHRDGIDQGSVDRHDELGRWTVSKIAPLLNPLMIELGYPELHRGLPQEGEEAERAQALARMVASMKIMNSGE